MNPALIKSPVYQQLHDLLRSLIGRGEFKAGQQFLTERQVSERFEISRATANKALASLVSEGLLEFRKGVGTFVREGVLDYDLRELVSFTDKARAAGKKPDTQVLAFETLAASEAEPGIAELLAADPDTPLYCMERLRQADALPVILERRYVRADLCPGLKRQDLQGSLYALWTDRYHLQITGADESIRAVNLDDRQASVLQVPPHTAALSMTAVGRISGNHPLWWEHTIYRADAYEFRNRLAGVRSSGPAVGRLVEGERQTLA